MRGHMRVVGWSVERPCVFHGAEIVSCSDEDPREHARWGCERAICNGCGERMHDDEGWPHPFTNYDLEIHGVYYPGAPAYTPRGEFAPVDQPEPPEFHIGRVCFAGTDAEFPWSLSEAEQHAIEEEACTYS